MPLILVSLVFLFVVAPLGEGLVYAAEDQTLGEEITDNTVGRFFAFTAELIFKFSGTLLGIAGVLLDYSISFSLDTDNYAKGAVANGWTVLRDVANITFIFILLYIAIGTILRLGTVNTRQALVNVVIIAFLINFSLFFTQIIVDTSNILATFFYNNASSITVDNQKSNLGEVFQAALQTNTLFKGEYTKLSFTKIGIANLMGAVAVLLAAFSFFAVAIMFIIRTAALIILMVLSPIAFAAYILDSFREHFTKWWKTLLNQAFFAPAYLLVIYVVLLIILSSPFQAATGNKNLAAAINTVLPAFEESSGTISENLTGGIEDFIPLEGTPINPTLNDYQNNFAAVGAFGTENFVPGASAPLSTLSVFFSYFLIIFLINGALVVAKQMGGATATLGNKWAGKGLGAAMGIGAFGLRHTVGRGFAALSRSEGLKNLGYERDEEGNLVAKAGMGGLAGRFAGRFALRRAESVAKSTFDARGGKLGAALGAGAGAIGASFGGPGGKGGFEAIRKEQINKQMTIAKSLGDATYSQKETDQIKLYEREISAQKKILEKASKGSTEEVNAKSALASYEDELLKLTGRGNVRAKQHAEDVEKGRLSYLFRDPKTNREIAKRIRAEQGKTKEEKLQDKLAGAIEKLAEKEGGGEMKDLTKELKKEP